ncbi:lysine--tRNA ligase [Patescibacteria group bacterium]
MPSIEEIRKARIDKLKNIKDPYPSKTNKTHTCQQAIDDFNDGEELILVGRLIAIREHGGSAFGNIEDGTAKFQIYIKRDEVGEKEYKYSQDNFDIGDFIEVKGILFLTKKQEKTLLVKNFRMLSKSLLPLPEKWHGIKDVEERFRKRYLDLIMNNDVRQKFLIRSKIIKSIRDFLNKKDFVEVETPILQTIPGGALARPFKTHHNSLDIDLYLRVAPELYLKRLLVGGFEKVYEIGRCFRNEGLDSSHNPDFTMLEFYWAYADYNDLMKITEEFFRYIVQQSGIKSEIDFQKSFEVKEFSDLASNDEELKEVVKKIIHPTFIVHHPIEISPLAKQLKDDSKKTERFQLVVGGVEIVNAFSELNNPLEQDRRFKEQEKNRQEGDEEAQRYDHDFIEALEYGMPPAAGFGMGIDRLAALLTDSNSLREIILFPLMKPKE